MPYCDRCSGSDAKLFNVSCLLFDGSDYYQTTSRNRYCENCLPSSNIIVTEDDPTEYTSLNSNYNCIDGKWYSNRYVKSCIGNNEIFFCNSCKCWHRVDKYEKIEIIYPTDCGNNTVYYCENGVDVSCIRCEDCGTYIPRGSSYTTSNRGIGKKVCYACYKRRQKYRIKSYHESVNLEWYDKKDERGNNTHSKRERGKPYFGFELEIGRGGETDENSEIAIMELKEEVYTMHDGSIDSGFEIISHPHSEEALYNLPYDTAFKKLVHKGYRSHDINTCGLHLHIGRELFKGEEAIAKMIYFYEKNKEDILKFSRRKKDQINRWASFYSNWSIKPTKDFCFSIIDDYDKRGMHDARYKAINLQGRSTVEVRLMKGTLMPDTFRATLDFMITIANNSNKVSWEDIDNNEKWLEGIKENTIKYMSKRKCFGYTDGEDNSEETETELLAYRGE
jgi:hypothetical protein